MKHFRLFSLFFGCWLLASCTADPGTEPGPFGENPPTAEKPHAVPVEQALEELQSVLEEIDIPAEDGAVTRSGGIRRVKNVTTVSPEALSPGGTRSEATADVEDLLYIVNFENEAGYAILGADDRLEPVYAVVDEGSLTTEEFRYAVTITDEQAQADGKFVFPLQLVAQAAIIGIENADTDADGGVAPMSDDGRHTGDLGGDVLRREYVYVTQEKFNRWAARNNDIDFNQVLANGALPMVATFADNFSKMVVTSNADWDEAHPAGTSLDDVLQVRINSSSDFVHDGYDMGEYKYEFLQNYDYLKTIEKRPSELTAADMKMVYYSLTDFSSQTKSPVIVFTSAPTLEKEHTLTLRWTTVEGDVKTASITCTPEVDPALQ